MISHGIFWNSFFRQPKLSAALSRVVVSLWVHENLGFSTGRYSSTTYSIFHSVGIISHELPTPSSMEYESSPNYSNIGNPYTWLNPPCIYIYHWIEITPHSNDWINNCQIYDHYPIPWQHIRFSQTLSINNRTLSHNVWINTINNYY